MKSPSAKTLPLMVKLIAEKSGLPTMAAISGVSRSLVNAPTTVANAAPTTTPTAISTTFPRRMNCLNPLSIRPPEQQCGTLSRKWRKVKSSAELLVPKSSPQIPAGDGTVWTPPFGKLLNVLVWTIHISDGPFQSDVSERQYVGITEHHDTEHGNCPRPDSLDSLESLLPAEALIYFCSNLMGVLKNGDAALGATLGQTEGAQCVGIWYRVGRSRSNSGKRRLDLLGEATCNRSRNLLSHDNAYEAPDGIFCR